MKNLQTYTIIGAGPSGLAAANELSKNKYEVTVYEKADLVGGLARTIDYKNCKYDIGPHRFYTLNKEVNEFYKNILGPDSITVKRLTRIFYDKKYFYYPLSPFNTLINLGIIKAFKILTSYFFSKVKSIFNYSKIKNFEDWVISNFGSELYKTFFKSYTEKVWGIECKNISKDWAAQRIKNISFFNVFFNSIVKKIRKKKVKSLVDSFQYPKYGAGFFYKKLSNKIIENGGKIELNSKLTQINHSDYKIKNIFIKNSTGIIDIETDFYIFSNPFTEIIRLLNPKPPQIILEACNKLKYRHHIGVKLEIHGSIFQDNWIYVHDPRVKMARISNYKNFSPFMSNSINKNPITVEYFCFENDKIWNLTDQEIISFAIKELKLAGIIDYNNTIENSFIVRSLNAYPVIAKDYQKHVLEIRNYLSKFSNLFPIGRSGMFKYNNQDHAIATGMYMARNLINEDFDIDIWNINSEGVYVEGEIKD